MNRYELIYEQSGWRFVFGFQAESDEDAEAVVQNKTEHKGGEKFRLVKLVKVLNSW